MCRGAGEDRRRDEFDDDDDRRRDELEDRDRTPRRASLSFRTPNSGPCVCASCSGKARVSPFEEHVVRGLAGAVLKRRTRRPQPSALSQRRAANPSAARARGAAARRGGANCHSTPAHDGLGSKWPESVMHCGPNRAWVPAIKVGTPRALNSNQTLGARAAAAAATQAAAPATNA